ncbi:hypothetical protein QEH52_06130 [Coraliomargarita sp. SDUM461003]|uniref:LPXTG cell wall anchor domain-containing protein n=1 Tax=Thalassobacterium maritimum TaxID=3041265 RepID=A0ABU1ATX9_9BACT|nr:hypothetical protein [Coraliomargarita sp. SDUM461003]MDQ8207077.1 hypothetical protein [Coraliomargarita sp. SDUM461003]
MKTILSLTSAMCLAVLPCASASSAVSSEMPVHRVSETNSLRASELAPETSAPEISVEVASMRPAVSGFEPDFNSAWGTVALLGGFAGMTFVMLRRRQAA